MFIVKHNGAYYTGKFEIEGTVLMVNNSFEKKDAKVFNTEHEIEEEMKNIKNYDYEIERVDNMSTRANIGILRKNGAVECVYSHSDGYPEYLGNLLLDHYTDKEDNDKTRQMIEMILSLGDVSFLEKKLQDSRFYNSWRNEGTKSKYYASLKEYITNLGDSWIEYSYLWDEVNKNWIYARYTDEFMVWTELMHTKKEGGEQNA